MTPQGLLAEAARRGIQLYADGYIIRYRGPKAALAELKTKLAAHKAELLTLLRTVQEQAETHRLARADGWRPPPAPCHPAYNILETCRRYGVALRIDETGELVVGRAGAKADESTQPWASLLMAIEAHVEAVALLIEAGWTVKAGFPNTAAA